MSTLISTRRTFWAWPLQLKAGRRLVLCSARKSPNMVRVRLTVLPGQQTAAALQPAAWGRAEARGMASVVHPARNPYRPGSHCWMLFESARWRGLAARGKRPIAGGAR